MRREQEVRQFWKDREQADRVLDGVRELSDSAHNGGITADEMVDALMEKDEFWDKLEEIVCKKPKRGRTRRT